MASYRIREAADLLGVSDDSLRRWADSGRVAATVDPAGRRVIEGAELARFAEQNAGPVPEVGTIARESARNRFVGLVTKVVRDKVMAQVEMQCGPYRVVSLMSREAADELGLEPGVTAIASVKSTNVVVEVPRSESMKYPFAARTVRFAAVPVALVALVAACSSSGSKGGSSNSAGGSASAAGPSGSISVYAAASLTEAFNTIKDQFVAAHPGVKITITYGASSDLSTQISQGAPVDVFASASEKNMTSLGASALSPTDFVSNTLEIAVPPSNPAKIAAVTDLAKSGVKVAVCDPAVPCGVVAATVFKNAKITVHPKATEADVKSTLAVVESGEVDAGLVYVTDVRAAGAKVKGIPIDASVNASTTYPIAVLKDAKNANLAKAFVDYVLSAAGSSVLTADGFSRP